MSTVVLDKSRESATISLRQLLNPLMVSIWFGLMAGLCELIILAIRKFVFGEWVHAGLDVVWMTPLSYVVIFAFVGSALAVAARLFPRLLAHHVIFFFPAFLASFSILFMFAPQVHKYAGMLLAAGLAVQSSRLISTHPDTFRVFAQRTAWAAVLLCVLVSAGMSLSRSYSERQALAALPAAQAQAPNVLLIILDTVRAQNLSAYGYERSTSPNLEVLAERGVLFDVAISTAPWTLPSHGSIFTGRLPHELSTGWLTPLDATHLTLAEVLARQGYGTAGFVANTGYSSYEQGLNRGFIRYEDYEPSVGQIVVSSSLGRYLTDSRTLRRLLNFHQVLGRKTAEEVTRSFLEWHAANDERPFFTFLNLYDAHGPYIPPAPFTHKFGPRPAGQWSPLARASDYSPEGIQAMIDGYDGGIAYADHHLGLLFEELDRRGALHNTLIIVTSDHGEEFGEHGILDHGNSLYLPSVHVPLIMALPGGVPEGERVAAPVSLRDLPATIVDIASPEASTPFPGTTLARFWGDRQGESAEAPSVILSEVVQASNIPEWLPVSRGDLAALMHDGWRYIRNSNGEEELYNFDKDPAETHDYLSAADSTAAAERLRHMLSVIRGGGAE